MKVWFGSAVFIFFFCLLSAAAINLICSNNTNCDNKFICGMWHVACAAFLASPVLVFPTGKPFEKFRYRKRAQIEQF